MQLPNLLTGFSRALYSNWLLYRPDNLLVDCGEGCATSLGNHVFAIDTVLLTHGHIDHISGLPSLMWARASAMGATEKPLALYYPAGDPSITEMRRYLQARATRLPYSMLWHELQPGDTVSLKGQRHARAFATQHVVGLDSLGYAIVEPRQKLRAEYQGKPRPELRQLAAAGAQLTEASEGIVAAFGGDGVPLRPEQVAGAQILVHEGTLLSGEELKFPNHSTVGQALEVAAKAGVRHLVINHISGRYRGSEVVNALRNSSVWESSNLDVWLLQGDKLWQPRRD